MDENGNFIGDEFFSNAARIYVILPNILKAGSKEKVRISGNHLRMVDVNMKTYQLIVGAYAVNCTIITFDAATWIMDPGADAADIISHLEKAELVPSAILLTHAHFDHVGAIPELQRTYPGLPVYVAAADVPVLTHPFNQMPPDYPPIPRPRDIREASALAETSGIDLRVIATPGHTPGGVCYYFPAEKLLFSGDTLFAGSVGRTDFPGGNMKSLMDSLAKLAALPDDVTVVPGHGPSTTIAAEKRGPWLS